MEAVRLDDEQNLAIARENLASVQQEEKALRAEVKQVIAKAIPGANTMDKDYVFINFVMTYLPHGIIGLLLAVVFSAAMSSTASELNSLASTTAVDIYKRSINATGSALHYLKASKWLTAMWAVFAMLFASIADQAENLIQFVNIIGSLFYGTILGIFLSAFYVKYIKSNAVFYAAIISESVVIYLYLYTDVAFLLYNIIATVLVIVLGIVFQFFSSKSEKA